MTSKKALVTVGSKWILELDAAPNIGLGFAAPVGSEAYVTVGGVGGDWFKYGSLDTEWRELSIDYKDPVNITQDSTHRFVADSDVTNWNGKYDATNPSGYETPSQLNIRDTNNRARANHTGSQLASTISDFLATVLASVLTGIVFTSSSVVAATDSILVAIGKLQAQFNLYRKFFTTAALNNSSSTTFTNITDLSFTVVAGKRYSIDGKLIYRSAATTTGLAITLLNTTAAGTLAVNAGMPIAADGANASFTGTITAFSDTVTSTAVQVINTDYSCDIYGVFLCTTSGTITPQFRSEVNTSQITIQAGSFLKVEEY